MRIAAAATAHFLGIALGATAALAQPSFDCARARGPVEKAICASPALSALDRGIAASWRSANERVGGDKAIAAALRARQKSFLEGRDYALEMGKGDGFRDFLKNQRDWLDDLTEARPGFSGRWSSSHGQITIKPRLDGGFDVEASAAKPVTAGWICDVTGIGKRDGDSIIIAGKGDDDDVLDGWRLKLARNGGTLTLEQIRPDAQASFGAPFCGANGSLEGRYLPVK